MEILVKNTECFAVEEKVLRQVKARDGELEGGWNLDIILNRNSKQRVTSVSFSVRYYNSEGKFVGLDTPYYHIKDINDLRDVSLYVDPPKEATKVELRISSKFNYWKAVAEDPKWAVIIIIAVVFAAIYFRELTR